MKLKRITEFHPGFDRRDPDPSKNYGIHGGTFLFLVMGSKGAVQFKIGVPFYPENVFKEHLRRGDMSRFEYLYRPSGWDVGYHSPRRMFEGQTPICTDGSCPYVKGKNCFYDGSGLRANEWLEEFLRKGTDWLWPALEQEYRERFQINTENT